MCVCLCACVRAHTRVYVYKRTYMHTQYEVVIFILVGTAYRTASGRIRQNSEPIRKRLS